MKRQTLTRFVTLSVALALLTSLLFLVDRHLAVQFQHNPSTIKWLARCFTHLIDPFFIACLSLALLLTRKEIFIKNTFALGAGLLSVKTLKWIIGRSRPNVYFSEGTFTCQCFNLSPNFQSFPSSHALAIFTVATTCAYIWPKYRSCFYFLAGFLAFSRVILHQHFLTDVICGALLGWFVTQKIGQVKLARLKQ